MPTERKMEEKLRCVWCGFEVRVEDVADEHERARILTQMEVVSSFRGMGVRAEWRCGKCKQERRGEQLSFPFTRTMPRQRR